MENFQDFLSSFMQEYLDKQIQAYFESQEKQNNEQLSKESLQIIERLTQQAEQQQKQNSKIFSDKYLVMQNRLLNAITDLNLNERRLIMFLSPIVRKQVDKDPNNRNFYVRVQDFTKHYQIRSKQYYAELEKTADTILTKAFFYWSWEDNQKVKNGASWVSHCRYLEKEGMLVFRLDESVIEMLTVFDKHNPFTKMELQAITNLGSYGIVMYMLISSCLHQTSKKKTYTIEFLREQFNCVDKYPIFSDFKRYVIQKSIDEIKAHTNLRISFEVIKFGRRVKELKFSFYEKTTTPKIDKKEINMTDSQRKMFAKKLSELSELSEYAPSGASYEEYAKKIESDLLDPQKAEFYRPYLAKVGYNPSYKKSN